jgi:hypothetical protein
MNTNLAIFEMDMRETIYILIIIELRILTLDKMFCDQLYEIKKPILSAGSRSHM